MNKPILNILVLEQAQNFLSHLPKDVYKKIKYNINRVLTGQYDKTIFKKLEGSEIWEVRTRYNGQQYRLFTFFDKYTGDLVVATHGIIKKTQKVPSKEIKKAEKIMKEYYIKKYSK